MKNLKLKAAREKCGLTQEQVAKKVGTTARAYQYYEAGEREPSASTAILIARAVKSTVEKLFG